jgi:hypothetical protein
VLVVLCATACPENARVAQVVGATDAGATLQLAGMEFDRATDAGAPLQPTGVLAAERVLADSWLTRPVDSGVPIAMSPAVLERLERDVAVVVRTSCTPCHAWSPRGLVQARSSCRTGGPVVRPFDADSSPLYRKLAGAPACGAMMPPTGGLPRGAADAVREWINAGAPVNGVISPRDHPEAPAPPVEWDADPN